MAVAKKYLHTIDASGNKIQNIVLDPLTSAQRISLGLTLGLADEGRMVYDVDLDQQYFWNGLAWITVGGSIGSISAGTTTLSLGQAVFSNANGISFGINGQTITASVNPGGGGNINFSAGGTSQNLSNIIFDNSNGVSFGLNGSTITASISALSTQSNQALSGNNGSFTFQTASFGDLNGLSFYTSNGSIVGSYTQSTHSHSSLVFSNDNNITFGIAGSTITASASYTVPNVTNSSWTASAGTATGTISQLVFNNSNGVSFGLDNGTITATVKTDYQTSGAYLTTAMQSDGGSNFVNTSAGLNLTNVSATLGSNSISLSVAAQSTQPVAYSAGNGSAAFSTLSFADSNGITFSTGTQGVYATVKTDYQTSGAYLTTAALSQDSSKYAGTNGAITGGSLTVNTSGISINLPAYLTTAMASNRGSDFIQANAIFAGTNVAGVIASSGISISVSNQSAQPVAASASNGSFNFSTLNFVESNGVTWATSTDGIRASVKTDYLTTAMASNRGSDFVQATAVFAGTNASGTINSAGISVSVAAQSTVPQNVSLYGLGNTTQNSSTQLSANALSFNAIGSLTVGYSNGSIQLSAPNALTTAMASNRGSDFIGTNTAITQNGVSMTANSSGLSLNFPAFLTTAALSNHSHAFATTTTNGTVINVATSNSAGITIGVPPYITTGLTTAAQSNQVVNSLNGSTGQISLNVGSSLSASTNGSSITFGLASNITTALQSAGNYLTTAMLSNAGSNFVNATAAFAGTNASGTIASNGISISVNSGGGAVIRGSGTYTQNTGTIKFSNSNGITFGLSFVDFTSPALMTASHNGLTTAMASNRGSDFMGTNTALTANGVSMTANSSGLSLNFPAFLTTAMLSNAATISNIKVSAGTLSALRSDISFNNSNGISFGLETNGIITATVATNYQSQGAYLTTARASNDAVGLNTAQSNVTWTVNSAGISFDGRGYAGTGTSATNASITLNSNGLAISVGAPAAGVGIAAGTRTATTAGNILFDNANGITFGLDNVGGSVMTASHNALTTAAQSNQVVNSLNGSTGQISLNVGSSLSTSTNGSSITFGLASNITTALQSAGAYLTTAMQSNAVTLSNIRVSAGTTSNLLSAITFDNANGLTFGLNAGTLTASHNGLTTAMASNAGSNFLGTNTALTANGVSMTANSSGLSLNFPAFLTTAMQSASSSNFAGTGSAITNGTMTFGTGGLSLNLSNHLTTAMLSNAGSNFVNATAAFAGTNASGTIASNGISVSVNAGGAALKGSGTYTQNTGTIEFANSNGITFGLSNNGTMTASHNGITTAMASNRGSDFIQATAVFNGTNASGTIASNAISVSVASQSNQTLGGYAIGNTTGQSSSSTFDARTLSFNGAGNISIGYSAGSIVISGGTAAPSPVNISAGTTSNNLGNIIFADANGVSFGLGTGASSQSITASINAAAQTVQTLGLYALGNTTQNSSTTLDARTLSYNGLGGMSVGYSNGSIQMSAPATSNLSATGHISISTNGNTISIGAPSPAISGSNGSFTFSTATFGNLNNISFYTSNGSMVASYSPPNYKDWDNFGVIQTMNNITNLTATGVTQRPMFFPIVIEGNLTWNRGMFEMSKVTNSQNYSFTYNFGIYSFANSTSINLIASLQNVFDISSASSVSATGVRRFAFTGIGAAGSTLSPGHYVGMMAFSASATAVMNASLRGGLTATPPLGLIGGGTNALSTANLSSIYLRQFQGLYTTTSNVAPAAVALANIQGWTSGGVPYVFLQST